MKLFESNKNLVNLSMKCPHDRSILLGVNLTTNKIDMILHLIKNLTNLQSLNLSGMKYMQLIG